MKTNLDGKVVIVTGAGSGIGQAAVLTFAAEGARVAAVDLNRQASDATVDIVRDCGGDAISLQADVSQPEQVKAMFEQALGAYGRIDCAVNNAGINQKTAFSIAGIDPAPSRTADCPDSVWDLVIAINLKSVFLCMQHEIRQMLKQGGGAIVNTASILGLVATAHGNQAYIASKHGVVGLTKAAALEYARDGIRVNAICPGAIDTPMVAGLPPEVRERYIASQPIGRFGQADEVARTVLWLCSDASSFVTGQSIAVDGGYVAQ